MISLEEIEFLRMQREEREMEENARIEALQIRIEGLEAENIRLMEKLLKTQAQFIESLSRETRDIDGILTG